MELSKAQMNIDFKYSFGHQKQLNCAIILTYLHELLISISFITVIMSINCLKIDRNILTYS